MKSPIALLFVTLLLGACARDEANVLVGTLERDRLELIAEANEPIVAVAVKEGDVVKSGATLVELDATIARARLAGLIAQADVAERRLAELVKGPRAQEIREARAAVEAAASAERTAQNEFKRIDDLVERRLLSQSQLDAARAERDRAIAALKQSRAQLDLLIEGTRRESIEQAQAELTRAKAALTEVEMSLSRHTVRAPRDGTIEALPFKLGERPPTGAPVVVMLAGGTPYARIYVPEVRRAELSPGTQVRVTLDGVEREFVGVTRFIAAQAQFTPYYALTQEDRSQLSYLAEIDLIESEAQALPVGIPVQVRVPTR